MFKILTINGLGNATAYFYDGNNNNIAVIGDTDKEYYSNIYTYNKDNNMTKVATSQVRRHMLIHQEQYLLPQ